MGRKIDAFPSHFWKWDGIYRPCRISSVPRPLLTTTTAAADGGGADAATYHPRFVEEVIDGVQRVDARNPAVVQCKDHVFPVVRSITGVLANKHQVRLETPANGYRTLRPQDTSASRHFGTLRHRSQDTSTQKTWYETLRHECRDRGKAGKLRPRTIPMTPSSTGDSA